MEAGLSMKKEVRVVGIDDVSFQKIDRSTSIIGVVYRGGQFMDGVMSTTVKVDGNDATEKIIEMLTASKFLPQLQYILLNGIAVAGFNVIDIAKLHEETKLGVIVVIRRHPDIKLIHTTLKRLGMNEKIKLLKKAGPIFKHQKIFFQYAGITEGAAHTILNLTATHSYIPEPIRVAHLVGQGLIFGESKGRA